MATAEGDAAQKQMDEILDSIEVCLQRVDASQGSMVRLRKAEIDLLGRLEAARDFVLRVVEGGDRALLRGVFGGDCGRTARLRAALRGIRLSEMNERDQRLASCSSACASLEELVGKELGLAAKLREATEGQQGALLARRVSAALDPTQAAALRQQVELNGATAAAEAEEAEAEAADAAEEGKTEDAEDDEEALVEVEGAAGEEAFATSARGAFDRLDKDSDGKVTKKELKQAIRKSRGLMRQLRVHRARDVEKLLRAADTDQDGSLDFDEFLAYLRSTKERSDKSWRKFSDSVVQAVFQAMDKDGDGQLTLQELQQAYAGVLLSAGERVSKDRVAKWAKKNLKKYDADCSQTLDLEEFRLLLERSGGLAPMVADLEACSAEG